MGSPGQPQSKNYVFIDSCVIQAAGDKLKSKSEAVIGELTKLAKEGFSLAISEYTVYENLHGLWGKKAIETSNILKQYEWKTVSANVLVLASLLGGLYYEAGYDRDRIRDGDKIITSTAILERGLILTNNHKDFPPPFLTTERSIPLTYNKGHYNTTIDLAIYKPSIELIGRRINANESRSS